MKKQNNEIKNSKLKDEYMQGFTKTGISVNWMNMDMDFSWRLVFCSPRTAIQAQNE